MYMMMNESGQLPLSFLKQCVIAYILNDLYAVAGSFNKALELEPNDGDLGVVKRFKTFLVLMMWLKIMN
ncbi:hypothetical protein E2542_SST02943 [Spatholobus suberectus]|nr:hypothetical protein E2542_SST02943 [Spatholobus suberectus]